MRNNYFGRIYVNPGSLEQAQGSTAIESDTVLTQGH